MKLLKGGVLFTFIYLFFIVNVYTYNNYELQAAADIAAKGYINTQSDEASYKLDNTITRAEIAKVASNIAAIPSTVSCENKFSDVSETSPNTWVCGYVEALLSAGLISNNMNYNPDANLTKAEAVKLILTVAGEEVIYDNTTWQDDFVMYAIENGIVAKFSDYNSPARRGFVFSVAAAATIVEDDNDYILYELDNLLWESSNNNENDNSIWFTTWGWFWADYVRKIVENWVLPNQRDIKYNNFLKDYSFDKIEWKCVEKFCPIFNWVKLINPISNIEENWLELYLWSNIQESDYTRLPTNFVIVIDTSGSMGSKMTGNYNIDELFDSSISCEEKYKYFKPLNKCILKEDSDTYVNQYNNYAKQSKMDLAKETTINLIWKLEEDDRIWIVTFNDESKINHPLITLNKIDIEILKKHINNISDWGGTSMIDGLNQSVEIFSDDILWEKGYQNRIIFITDAMPNKGNTSEKSFKTLITKASEKNIYFSFMWVGLDFDQELINNISQTKWWNYFFINSGYDFYRTIIQDFDYNFFPMFFNVNLKENKQNISEVYGLDSDIEKWELIKINTLFPSKPKIWGSTKGSIILFKLLEKIDKDIVLDMEYEDLNWNISKKEFPISKDLFNNTKSIWELKGKSNISKAVLIIEFVRELKQSIKNWEVWKLEDIELLLNNNKNLFSNDDEQLIDEIKFLKQLILLLWKKVDYWND